MKAKNFSSILVLGVTIEVLLVERLRQDLEVATTAVDVLLVLDGELEDEILTLVGEISRQSLGDGVETVVLGGAETWRQKKPG
jgi:hypothetical protein